MPPKYSFNGIKLVHAIDVAIDIDLIVAELDYCVGDLKHPNGSEVTAQWVIDHIREKLKELEEELRS